MCSHGLRRSQSPPKCALLHPAKPSPSEGSFDMSASGPLYISFFSLNCYCPSTATLNQQLHIINCVLLSWGFSQGSQLHFSSLILLLYVTTRPTSSLSTSHCCSLHSWESVRVCVCVESTHPIRGVWLRQRLYECYIHGIAAVGVE